MERLQERDFHRLRQYRERGAEAGGSFETWLRVVTKNTARDYLRSLPGYDHAEKKLRSITVPIHDHEPTTSLVDAATLATGRQILAQAKLVLDDAQLEALVLWIQGHDHGEITMALALESDKHAERLVRSALKRLRDRYASRESPDPVALVDREAG
jgi:DNA-directed RNA polymerase specialized sigma24 family protein